MKAEHFEQGNFFIGCNYWASHAGMRMWSQWDEATVGDDLDRLAANRATTLRVFPLWSDFQPIRTLYGGGGVPREVRRGETPLGFDEMGRSGIDPVMMERFKWFCDAASKRGISLIVGLLTGWMSGRLFVPEMLQGRNVITDPLALQWEIRFVRCFVRRFAGHPAIVAWDLGNECNCMGRAGSPEAAYAWTAAISMAIRAEDRDRPIVSGMHGLSPQGEWRMQDQGELLDVLCTHPYPIFTPHCDTDPLTGMKSPLHASAESLYYAGIGGKQCFAEETGTLGPMVISDELGAEYIRRTLFTLLGNDCRGLLWWCGFEQKALDFAPYDWNGVERELGLFYLDKTPKPVLRELSRFSEYVESLPFDRLPARINEAVCVLTRGQDSWAAAYGAFILATQAGIGLRFAWADGEIPDSPAYILPDLEGDASLSRHAMMELLDRVRKGASLYISLDGALLSPFAEYAGLRAISRAHDPEETSVDLDGAKIRLDREFRGRFEPAGAQVLARTEKGDVAFACNEYGQGRVYVTPFPIEKMMAVKPGVVDDLKQYGCFRFYRAMGLASPERALRPDCAAVGVTEHPGEDGSRIAVLVNYRPEPRRVKLNLAPGWRVDGVYPYAPGDRADAGEAVISANSAMVLILKGQ